MLFGRKGITGSFTYEEETTTYSPNGETKRRVSASMTGPLDEVGNVSSDMLRQMVTNVHQHANRLLREEHNLRITHSTNLIEDKRR